MGCDVASEWINTGAEIENQVMNAPRVASMICVGHVVVFGGVDTGRDSDEGAAVSVRWLRNFGTPARGVTCRHAPCDVALFKTRWWLRSSFNSTTIIICHAIVAPQVRFLAFSSAQKQRIYPGARPFVLNARPKYGRVYGWRVEQ